MVVADANDFDAHGDWRLGRVRAKFGNRAVYLHVVLRLAGFAFAVGSWVARLASSPVEAYSQRFLLDLTSALYKRCKRCLSEAGVEFEQSAISVCNGRMSNGNWRTL